MLERVPNKNSTSACLICYAGQPFPLPSEIGQAGHVELEVTFDPPVAMEGLEWADGASAAAGEMLWQVRSQYGR